MEVKGPEPKLRESKKKFKGNIKFTKEIGASVQVGETRTFF